MPFFQGFLFEKHLTSNIFGEAYFDLKSIISSHPYLTHTKWYMDINYIAFKRRQSMRNILVDVVCTSCYANKHGLSELGTLATVEKMVTNQRTVFSTIPLRCKKTHFSEIAFTGSGAKIFLKAAIDTPATNIFPAVAKGEKWTTFFRIGISLFTLCEKGSKIFLPSFLRSKSINKRLFPPPLFSGKMNALDCDIYTLAAVGITPGVTKIPFGRVINSRPLLATGRWFLQIEAIYFQDPLARRRALLSIHSPQILSPHNEPISLGFIEKVANYNRIIFSGADFARVCEPREITYKEGCQEIKIYLMLLDDERAEGVFPALRTGNVWNVRFDVVATLYIPKAQPRAY